ncbi:hypothetical protein Elgi_37930 [Paenibacillus elgii]|uniref:hypothetical protein n=1 Tax=Paenibacillus elgii TaxID=189691 RepID=UPI002D7DBF63|nr:hypothetical protein Elgi_37930 [Paenibacillus elgii]
MTTENKNQRESENFVELEGFVHDINIEETTVDGKEAITGEINIQVGDDSIHTINIFSYKINKKGKESGLYKGYQTIKNEYKSINDHGKECADKVRIDEKSGGKISLNEYVGQDGEWKSYPKISASFINRLKSNDVFTPKAKFNLEMAVASVKEEMKNDVETGRAIIKGYVAGYEGKTVFPFEVVVADPQAVNYVTSTYEKGSTVTVYGDIINRTIETKKEIEAGFGKPQEKIDRKTVREFLVVGGSTPLEEDDERAFSAAFVKKGIKEREAMIEEKKAKKKVQTKKEESQFNKDRDKGMIVDISDDSLPF